MKVFISHAHDNDPFARRVAETLRAGGFDAW